MSYNGSGSFLINTAGQPVVSGTVISSTAFNALTADLATGLSTCITKDGQTTVTANIPMANYKFTGLGAGSGAADSANLSQVQSTVVKLLASVSGTDTITAVGSPTVAAYAAGQMFYFVAAGDNTGAVTINIDSLGAKAVTRDGSVALAAGDIKSGEVVVIVYDGTRFQVVSQLNSSGDARFANVSIASALNVGGVATVTGGSVLNGGVVINEPGADVDFRVEGDTDANLIFADASTDRVGVGTNTPGTKFDVAGIIRTVGTGYSAANSPTLYLENTTASTGRRYALNSANSGIFQIADDTAGGASRIIIDASGNLGLGVTPSAWASGSKAIEIGAAGTAVWNLNQTNTSYTCNAYYDGAYKYGGTGLASAYQQAAGLHYWYTAPSGTAGNTITFTQAMTLDASGDLYLGGTTTSTSTGSRGRTAAIIASSDNSVLTIESTGTTANANYAIIDFVNRSQSSGGTRYAEIYASRSNTSTTALDGYMAFATTSGGTTSERARITSGGDLLVNNTATIGNCRVEITDSGNSEQLLISGANQTGIQIRNASGGAGWIIGRSISANNANDFFIFDHANSTNRLLISTDGEVRIAGDTDQGAYNLQVNGTGVWGAGAYVNGSDERLKDNIQSLDSGLDVVKAMRAVTFQYKPEHSKDQSVQPGFIAQELQQAMAGKPYLEGVVQAGPEYLNVAYQNIIPILVKAIQELEAKVAALEAK